MKKQLSPGATAFILVIAMMVIGSGLFYFLSTGGKEVGGSMADAIAQDKKNAAARGEKPPVIDPNVPRPKMVTPEMMKQGGHFAAGQPITPSAKPNTKTEPKSEEKSADKSEKTQ